MEIEDQVCSLELAKRLKELGVKQESLYCYVVSEVQIIEGKATYNNIILTNRDLTNSPNSWSAFTVAELGEMLPELIGKGYPFPQTLRTIKVKQKDNKTLWVFFYAGLEPSVDIREENEANARAKMLIYLIDNHFLKIVDGKLLLIEAVEREELIKNDC